MKLGWRRSYLHDQHGIRMDGGAGRPLLKTLHPKFGGKESVGAGINLFDKGLSVEQDKLTSCPCQVTLGCNALYWRW